MKQKNPISCEIIICIALIKNSLLFLINGQLNEDPVASRAEKEEESDEEKEKEMNVGEKRKRKRKKDPKRTTAKRLKKKKENKL